MGERKFFVSSGDIPDDLAEALAAFAHRRGCGAFDASRNRERMTPFTGSHKANDIVWASVHIADLCNVLQIRPDALLSLRGEAADA